MFISNYTLQNTVKLEKIYESNSNNYNFQEMHEALLSLFMF